MLVHYLLFDMKLLHFNQYISIYAKKSLKMLNFILRMKHKYAEKPFDKVYFTLKLITVPF